MTLTLDDSEACVRFNPHSQLDAIRIDVAVEEGDRRVSVTAEGVELVEQVEIAGETWGIIDLGFDLGGTPTLSLHIQGEPTVFDKTP